MMNIKALVVGVGVALAPLAANAVVINPGMAYSITSFGVVTEGLNGAPSSPGFMVGGDTLQSVLFQNNTGRSVRLVGSANNIGCCVADIESFEADFFLGSSDLGVDPMTDFVDVMGGMGSFERGATVADLTLGPILDGEFFVLSFQTAGITDDVATDYIFSVNPIPLPAAGWMLIGGLAGLGFLGRRRTA